MRKQFLNNYRLTASIHTIAIKTPTILDDIPNELQAAVKCSIHKTRDHLESSIILNLNKISGEVYCYSRFKELFNMFLDSTGIEEYKIVRADMSFDSFDSESYLKYAKLNRYLISMLAVKYNVRNAYRTTNLFSQKQLSVAIKNSYFECENYDKEAESHGTNVAYSRFEERSKRWKHKDIRKEFEEHWFQRWDEALKMFYQTYIRYNDELEHIFLEEQNSVSAKARSMNDFLTQHQECIFSNPQVINFLSRFKRIGPDKAKKHAENYKLRYQPEYCDYEDLVYAVNEIKRATTEYFDN